MKTNRIAPTLEPNPDTVKSSKIQTFDKKVTEIEYKINEVN